MNNKNAHKPGYKHTPLGWIPENWDIMNLGQLGALRKGKGITKEQLTAIGLPCIRYGEIYTTHDFIIREFKSHIPKEVADESQEITNGDVLFAGSGETIEEIGKAVAYTKDIPAYAGGDIIILSTKENTSAEFISYMMETALVRKQKRVLGQGNSVVHIYASDLAKVKVPLPSQKQQWKIAAILTTWAEAVQTMQCLIEQLKQRNKGLSQQLLNGKKRLKGFNGEWKEYSYEQLFKIVKRPVAWDDNTLYRLISVRRRSGGIFEREALYGHQIKVKDLRTTYTGDFLFSKMQIVHGASALVTNEFDGCQISGSYIAVVAKDQKVLDLQYLNWHSQLPFFYHQTYISSYGVHIEKMTFDFESFLSLGIQLPSVEEQRAIVGVLKSAADELKIYEQKLVAIQQQKKGLMQKLLSGEVRVKI